MEDLAFWILRNVFRSNNNEYKMKKIIVFVCLLVLLFPITEVALARADDLVIQDNGQIDLVITNNGSVLGVTAAPAQPAVVAPKTTAPQTQTTKPQTQQQPQTPPSTPAAPVKTVTITAPHSESTVQINPPINDSKKIQIIITTPTNTSQTPTTAPALTTAPVKIISPT